jgi:hypothetical protein
MGEDKPTVNVAALINISKSIPALIQVCYEFSALAVLTNFQITPGLEKILACILTWPGGIHLVLGSAVLGYCLTPYLLGRVRWDLRSSPCCFPSLESTRLSDEDQMFCSRMGCLCLRLRLILTLELRTRVFCST